MAGAISVLNAHGCTGVGLLFRKMCSVLC